MVNRHNINMLHSLSSNIVDLSAIDKKPATLKDYTQSSDARFTGGLPSQVSLAIGARVMLTRNLDVADGLVNSAQGAVAGFQRRGSTVVSILVQFDNPSIGKEARRGYGEENCVSIHRVEAKFSMSKRKKRI